MTLSRVVVALLVMAVWSSDAFAQTATSSGSADEKALGTGPVTKPVSEKGNDAGVYPASKLELQEKKKSEEDVKICKNC